MEFKPLVQVDPSVFPSTRIPLKNPRVGDYQLKQTASTEGIASKKSLELKKRYLLGENVLPTGLMKSDSTSILDSKLRNFHSNISGCQKLLNPAPDISPALQTFLKNTIASQSENFTVQTDVSSDINRIVSYEEKENVYEHIVNTKNELNKSEKPEVRKRKKSENAEISIDMICQSEKEPPTLLPNAVETIDLVTPEKITQVEQTDADNGSNSLFNASDNKIKIIQIQNTNNDVFIDLTGDTSLEQLSISIEEDNVRVDSVPIVKNEVEQTILSNHPFEPRTVTSSVSVSASRTHGGTESSSSKSSTSSSSPAGIPHHILESTTNTSADATPIESNELMQMDSLMIVDGKYTGDPEDLKHMKLPEVMKNVYKPIDEKCPAPEAVAAIRAFKYESIYKRPELKFDTRNENKIDSLRNLPLLLPQQIDQNIAKVARGLTLNIGDRNDENNLTDNDITPTVANPSSMGLQDRVTIEEAIANKSDSETETTGCICTETELSDWTADDAVSENFVDIEFALNSNKGTLKRNKWAKKRVPKFVAANHQMKSEPKCPIATCLDFDGIEFMDTGSEESCMETYAASNDAMLKNRGYVQFVNANAPSPKNDYYSYEFALEKRDNKMHDSEEKCVEKMRSADFIEQGACVLDKKTDLRTLNAETVKTPLQATKVMAEPVNTSFNEVEDESIVIVSSQCGENTTTEESEALTIVTSPLESAPRNIEASKQFQINRNDETGSELASNKDSDDITYGDYVRQLQMAITQISNARDSIDIRKMKRKHSKGEICASEQSKLVQTPLQSPQSLPHSPHNAMSKHNKSSNKSLSIYVSKADEPTTTVIEKLEEITKERTKQKDLIHDLVMNKLQSKKKLNAEKRLNRSRNRSSALSLSPGSNGLPPPPPDTTTTNTSTTDSEIHCAQNRFVSPAIVNEPNCDHDNRKACKNDEFNSKKNVRGNQRPLSDNVDAYFETPKLNKTKSFCAYEKKSRKQPDQQNKSPINTYYQSRFASNVNTFSTPLLPSRKIPDDVLCQSTDELRQDARLRARLMSNEELGLSPEDKMNLLRKSHKSGNVKDATQSISHQNVSVFTQQIGQPNKSDDMKVRERKMLASKSVNDIAATNLVLDCDNSSVGNQATFDFTSDSNLNSDKPLKRRQKDPERRKSIIQAVSEFFHKKKDKEQPGSPREKNDSVFGLFRISPKVKSKVDSILFDFFYLIFNNIFSSSYNF